MDARFDISIIIVNYNSCAFTRACLNSIRSSRGDLRLEIIVIDNASFDGCGEMIRSEFLEAAFIQNPCNLGFAGANNLGVAVSRGAHLLFLNPDTELQPGALAELLNGLSSTPDTGVVGGRLQNSDLSLQTTSIAAFPTISNQLLGVEFLQRRFPKARLWGMKALYEEHSAPVEVDAVSGACMLVRRDVIDEVEGFSRDFFMYGEDLDLCLKVKKAGWKTYYVPRAVIVHHGGRSSDSREQSNYAAVMIRESMWSFMRKHQGPTYAALFRLTTAVFACLRLGMVLLSSPAAILPSKRPALTRIAKKWFEILRWALSLQKWVAEEKVTPKTAPPATNIAELPEVSR